MDDTKIVTDEDKDLSSTSSNEGSTEGTEESKPKGRTAEDRINELLSKNKEMAEKLDYLSQKMDQVPTPPARKTTSSDEDDPEVQKAISFLKSKGKFVDEEYVETRLKSIQDRMIADSEHQRLENNFSGQDGRPKYDRQAIEDHARKKGIWNFEAAYNDIYKDELFDWQVKKVESDRKKKPYTVRPNSTGGEHIEENTITREKIEGWLKGGAEGRAKYEQNRDKILKLMAEQKL